MSNLEHYLVKRRSKFYEGEMLTKMCDSFRKMVADGAEVLEFKDTVIVLEKHGMKGNVRAWLLFDQFTKSVVTAIKKVSDEFNGTAIYTSTHDARIKKLLVKFGYVEYAHDKHDFYLKRTYHGM